MHTGGPVFVVGMPRSGTTLMRSILNAHSSLALAPETHFINHWMQVHRHTNLREPAEFDRLWNAYVKTVQFGWLGLDADTTKQRIYAAGTPTFQSVFTALIDGFAERQGKQRSGEKTPDNYRYLDLLFGWYPTGRAIYMLRDPRAVVASFKALDQPWTDKPTEVIAARWRRAAERAERSAEDERVLLVHYLDLVSDPAREVTRVCEHIGEAFEPHLLETRARDASRATKPNRPVTAESLERWRHELSEEEIAIIEHLSQGPFGRLGFERVATPLPRRTQLALDIRNLRRRVVGAVRDRIR